MSKEKDNDKQEEKKREVWTIVDFPEEMRNRAVGYAKMKGVSTAEMVIDALNNYFMSIGNNNRKG